VENGERAHWLPGFERILRGHFVIGISGVSGICALTAPASALPPPAPNLHLTLRMHATHAT